MVMKTTINLIILFVACTVVNIGLTLYYFESSQQKQPAVKINAASVPETAALAAALHNINKHAVMRDTVILQQILRVQHHLKMHGQRVPMCPDCRNKNANTEYRYTKDVVR